MNKWTEVIRPERGWLSLNVREVWQYRDLILLFVRRDFVTHYKQTILGPLWFIIQPVFTGVINLFVFGGLANLGPAGVPAFLFYLSGPILWQYFQDCMLATADTFKKNEYIFGKVYYPRIVMPISVAISNLLKLGVQLCLLLAAVGYLLLTSGSLYLQTEIYILPLLILLMGILALGFGLIVSSLTTKYRDLKFLFQFVVPLLKYITPGIATTYAIFADKLPHGDLIAFINPMGHLIDAFNFVFTGAGEIRMVGLGYSFSFAIVLLFVGLLIFNKTEQNFIDTI